MFTNKIFSLFLGKPKQTNDENDILKNTKCSITFSVVNDDNVRIDCNWVDDKDIGLVYGELLYHINNGDFITSIINVLVDTTKVSDNEKRLQNVTAILDAWKLIKEYEEEKPLIQPLDVFKIQHSPQRSVD